MKTLNSSIPSVNQNMVKESTKGKLEKKINNLSFFQLYRKHKKITFETMKLTVTLDQKAIIN